MVAVAAGCRKAPVNARWTILLHCCTNGPKKILLSNCRGSMSDILGSFQSGEVLSGRRALTIECSLMSGCGQGHELAEDM